MQKYKSNFINEEDIKITVTKTYVKDGQIQSIEIEHLPTGLIVSSEDKIQIEAYNKALKCLENVLDFKSQQ